MITIRGRELIIPKEDRTLGTDYDVGVENRLFSIDRVNESGTDISHLEFTLDAKYNNTTYNSILLKKEITDDQIILTWVVDKQTLTKPGTIFASLRAVDEFGTIKWATNRGAFYILDSVNTPGHYTGELTEFEQLEARLKAYRDETNALKTQTEQVLADTQLVKQETEAVLAQAKQDIVELDARIEQVEQDIANATTTMEEALEAAKEIEQTIATVNGLLTQCQQQVALATAQAQEAAEQVGLAQQQVALAGLQVSLAADEADRAEAAVEEAKNVVKNFSNVNLIDNPNLKINQRLLNEYEGAGIYSIDRWKIHGGGGKVSIVNGVVSMFANKSNTMTLEQLLLNGTLIPGKEYTLSSSIIEESVSFTYETTGSWNIPTSFGKIDVYNPTSGYVQVRFVINSGNTVTFDTSTDFIKLEPGMLKTPYNTPNQALELEKCKYFCEVFGSNGYFRCLEMLRVGSESIDYILPITEKVTNPTMNFSGTFLVRSSTNLGISLSNAVPSQTVMSKKNAGIKMTKTTTAFPTEQTHLVLDNAKIIVSSDLF